MEAEIKALLQENGVGFKTNTKSFILTCPRCRKSQKLYIRRKDGRFVCWYCREIESFHGAPEYVLVELCSEPMAEIRRRLYGDENHKQVSIYLDLDVKDFEDEDSEDLIDITPKMPTVAWPLDFFTLDNESAAKGVAYLESRGIPKSIAMEYGIRYWPAKSRVVFPVQSRGDLYGWQARLVENDKPYWSEEQKKLIKPLKALTYTDLKRDRVLMFADRLEGSKHCILTEGPMDALKAHLCGGNIATMGKAVAITQLQLLRNAGIDKLYMGLDPDAYLEVNRIRKQMSDLVLYDLRPPAPYKDLGEMPMEEVRALFDNAPELNPGHVIIYLKNMFGA